jgi:hypothetical protein
MPSTPTLTCESEYIPSSDGTMCIPEPAPIEPIINCPKDYILFGGNCYVENERTPSLPLLTLQLPGPFGTKDVHKQCPVTVPDYYADINKASRYVAVSDSDCCPINTVFDYKNQWCYIQANATVSN